LIGERFLDANLVPGRDVKDAVDTGHRTVRVSRLVMSPAWILDAERFEHDGFLGRSDKRDHLVAAPD
jgi:hypothetical protein